uniref:Uncharacterized protein n=1 Tax=OCS116 cluster bacterium TaxID=2030921 RepID=A0A2A4Z8R3_9PROT
MSVNMGNKISQVWNGMKTCKTIGLIFSLAAGTILSACSNPVGDFGRINKSRATHITEVGPLTNKAEKTNAYYNPLDYSKAEKQLRLTAVLLERSNYDIHIADRQFVNGVANVTGPIREAALVNNFRAKGVSDMSSRYQSLSGDLKKRRLNLDSFIRLTKTVIRQDVARGRVENEIVDIKAIGYRQKENVEVITGVKKHMEALYLAYRYVLNHGKIVEPTVSQFAIRSELELFNKEVEQLTTDQ